MTPQELKNSILQLAIQGKLVEQRLEEGNGEELYQQIQAEKQRLIKEGKIKKQKPLPEIAEDEIPFDIPDSWKWCRVSELVELNPKNDISDDIETAFIPMSFVMDGFRNEHTFEIKKWGDIKKGFTHFADGDIGVAKITPCFQNRKSVVFKELKNGYGAGTTELSIVRVLDDLMTREYLLWFFKTDYFISNGIKSFTGTAGQQRIHKDYLASCLIPLPPLKEQKRIVAKLEELLPYIDRYEQAWSKLEAFNKRFPTDMQKSLLQMAIQGKLVEQRPEEGTGEELFTQIQAEKQKLIKEGKIKKDKPLPEITDDEKPFDIPDNWKWVRLGELLSIQSGEGLTSNQMQEGKIPVYGGNGITGYHNKGIVHDETVVIGRVGFYCGSVHVTEKEAWVTDNAFITTYPKNYIFREYLVYMLRHMNLGQNNNATAQPVVSGKKIYPMLFPLPPLAEQKRIVAKLEELLPLCERLK